MVCYPGPRWLGKLEPTRWSFGADEHTCTNSIIDGSPTSLFAMTLVAGNAFGSTWRTMLRLALVTVKEEIVTATGALAERISGKGLQWVHLRLV